MLSKTALSAVKALAVLAELPRGEYEGAASVAERIGAPQNYLAKQLKALARIGLLQSQKGLGGGFRLGRPAEQITLFDVVEPIDQVSKWEGCFLGGRCHGSTPCSVHTRWNAVREAYLGFLTSTSIKELGA